MYALKESNQIRSCQMAFAVFVFVFLICSSNAVPDNRPLADSDCTCDVMRNRPTNNPNGSIYYGIRYRVLNQEFAGASPDSDGLLGELASVAVFYVRLLDIRCPLAAIGMLSMLCFRILRVYSLSGEHSSGTQWLIHNRCLS